MVSRFNPYGITLLILLVFFLSLPSCLWGQQKNQGPPPANVSVAEVKSGIVAPQAEFIATVFFQEISDTAAEISGLAEVVRFEEGQRVTEKQILVELGSELLQKRLQATTASYEQVLSELEIARIDFKRSLKLFKRKSISEQSYDEKRFRVIGLEKRAIALKAQVQQLEIELYKKRIRAPFDGVVIKRHVDRGEWISEGETVAVIGKDDTIDIVADIPERFIQYVKNGMRVNAMANGNNLSGTVIAIVPRGDIATRTFPVKIRTANEFSLIEGMSARVILPTAKSRQTLIIPRDAVIAKFGQDVVFAVSDSKARMMPVHVIGYNGLNAGIESAELKAGMLVVVEGNERLRNEQVVVFQKTDDSKQNSEVGMRKSED
jgi:RND family efflux transporter MFP subunit